jgi:MYXO-CTERM domain-containing protein
MNTAGDPMLRAPALLAAAALLASPAAHATDAETIAIDWIEAQTTSGAIAAPDALAMTVRLVLEWPGGTRVRIAQELLGIPVVGHEIILSIATDGRIRHVLGEPTDAVLLDPSPTLTQEDAEARAQAGVTLGGFGRGQLFEPYSELVVHVDRGGAARLAWRVHVSSRLPVNNWSALVDAHTGAIFDWQQTMHSAQADIYPTNPDVSELTEVTLPRLSGGEVMAGSNAFVYSCPGAQGQCDEKVRFAVPDGNGDFFFEPDASSFEDPLAEVQMYYHLDLVSQWFIDHYNFEHGLGIEGLVNLDVRNAFYGNFDDDPYGEVAFGQWSNWDFGYDADVIYHEFMHSVFGQIVNPTFINGDEYGLVWAPGALNEGSADALALVLTGDPQLGEYAGAGFGLGTAPVRDLEPDMRCPIDLYGQSHRDGQVWGSFAWNLIDDPDVGAQTTADLFYGALLLFSDQVDWAEAGAALTITIDELVEEGAIDEGTAEVIREAQDAHGLVECGRVIPLDNDEEPTQLMIHPGFVGDVTIPLGHQLSIHAPEGATRIRLRIKDFDSTEPNLGWTVFIRRGEHVVHEVFEIGFGTTAIPDIYDWSVDGEGDGVEINVELGGDLPLEPGATYYFAIGSRQLGPFQGLARADVTVDGRLWAIEPEDDDDDNDGGAGCSGCASSFSSGRPPGGTLMGLVAFLGLRRRRVISASVG